MESIPRNWLHFALRVKVRNFIGFAVLRERQLVAFALRVKRTNVPRGTIWTKRQPSDTPIV
jgi:hypothetical protein